MRFFAHIVKKFFHPIEKIVVYLHREWRTSIVLYPRICAVHKRFHKFWFLVLETVSAQETVSFFCILL